MNKKFEYMLRNAGEIQHYKNILRNAIEDDMWICYDNKHIIISVNGGEFVFPEKISLFIIKGRELKSGLKSSMGRYYGWKAINCKEVY